MNELLRLLAIGIFLIPNFLSAQNNCNSDVALAATFTSMDSPLAGPYQPGESVTFCFNLDDFQKNNCNWLHGVVPKFGNGWDASSFSAQGEPQNISSRLMEHTNGNWAWFPNNWVTYKASSSSKSLSPGDKVGAGWFFLNFKEPSINPFDPNFTFGDDATCSENNNQWEVCFSIKAKEIFACEGETDCSVTIVTFGDGETGGRSQIGCTDDEPIVFAADLDCCSAPTVAPINNQIICSGDQISITILSDNPDATYTWEATDFNVSGSSDGDGAVIQQTLTADMPGIPAWVSYTITPELDGCQGLPYTFVASISNVSLDLGDDRFICSGQSIKIGAFPEGGQSPYTYAWAHGPTFFRPTVSPNQTTTYTLTVTDAFGCSVADDITVFVGQAGPIVADGNPCDQDLVTYTVNNFPGALGYNWSVPNDAIIIWGQGTTSISVDWGNSDGGNVCVSLNGGCSSGLEPNCLDVVVGDPITTNGILGEEFVCSTTDNYFYSVIGIQPGFSYLWAAVNGTILTDPTANYVEVDWNSSVENGLIAVTISNGCNSKVETIETTVVYPNDFEFSGAAAVCPGEIATYEYINVTDASANTNYQWSINGGTILTGQGTDAVIVEWGTSASGQIDVTAFGSCDLSNYSFSVQPFDALEIDVVGNSTSCQGQIENYFLSEPLPPGTNVLWNWPAEAELLSDPGEEEITVKWLEAPGGIISVFIESCESATVVSNLEVAVEESTVVDSLVTLCEGNCFDIGGQTFCDAGVYTVSASSSGGCGNVVQLTLEFLETPDVVADAGDDTTVGCTVDRILDASNSVFPPTAIYSWKNEMNEVVGSELTLTVSEPGTYTFGIFNPVSLCASENEVVVSPAAPPVSDAGDDKYINCFNDNMVTIGPAVAEDLDYEWTGPMSFSSTDANPKVTIPGIYELTVSDSATGCGSDMATVEVFDGYTLDITAYQSICDAIDGAVELTSIGIEAPVFNWSTNESGNMISDLAPGDYSVTVSSPLGACEEVLHATVTADLSCKVLIAGNVFDDGEKGLCTVGAGTIPVEDIPVTIHPLELTVLTDADGYYEFLVDTGSYELTVVIPEPYFVLCPGFSVNEVTLSDTSDVSLDNHFFLDYATNFDLFVTAFASTPNPGSNQNYQVTYCNNFVQTINGKIEFIHDPEVTFDPVANNASSYDPVTRTATWLFAGLSFFECEYLNFSVAVPPGVSAGTEINATVIGRPILGDVSPGNNIVELVKIVPNNNEPPQYGIESSDNIYLSELEVYPNPTPGKVQLTFPSQGEEYTLEIYDVSGKMVNRLKSIEAGSALELNLRNAERSNELLLLKLIDSNGHISIKRVLVH